ncbi:MAG: crossover junction endodeoxyribonuclease RuvC, partial [Myxococcales bacterium]|nr:crossover junction endodeoxyribonuclease RuvC [Myxococcales bacterium]
MTVVLGLDPGTRHFGWGVVRRVGTRLSHIAHGVLDVEREGELGDRLVAIESRLVEVVREYRPDQASIESLFFA